MVSKCANPNCSNTFRYLHEGKLYLLDGGSAFARRNGSRKPAEESRPLEYIWLCSSCCRYMAVRIEEELGVSVVPKAELPQDQKFGVP
jgi:hypothetical protein